jgi:hypothetical protein
MERTIATPENGNRLKAISYEQAAAEIEKEAKSTEVLSCSLQLKNLLKTNLKLLKLNEITSMLLF